MSKDNYKKEILQSRVHDGGVQNKFMEEIMHATMGKFGCVGRGRVVWEKASVITLVKIPCNKR